MIFGILTALLFIGLIVGAVVIAYKKFGQAGDDMSMILPSKSAE